MSVCFTPARIMNMTRNLKITSISKPNLERERKKKAINPLTYKWTDVTKKKNQAIKPGLNKKLPCTS